MQKYSDTLSQEFGRECVNFQLMKETKTEVDGLMASGMLFQGFVPKYSKTHNKREGIKVSGGLANFQN